VGPTSLGYAWVESNVRGSSGGYSTLIGLTRQSDLCRAGVDLFGIANLSTFLKATSGANRELFKTEFGDLEKDADLLDEQSPLRHVDKIVDPLFVYAGANDPRVLKSQSDLIVRRFVRARFPGSTWRPRTRGTRSRDARTALPQSVLAALFPGTDVQLLCGSEKIVATQYGVGEPPTVTTDPFHRLVHVTIGLTKPSLSKVHATT
jgi:hypothetical protein